MPLDASDPLTCASVRDGNLYLAREVCERFLPNAESVALLRRQGEHGESELLILPLTRESGGGLLLKIRNAHGDRVVHAQEFFRTQGYVEDAATQQVAMRWSEPAAALILSGVARVSD
jgi:hypothetical protein